MTTVELVFSSEWLKNPLQVDQQLEDLQYMLIDEMEGQNADTLLITTTHSFETGGRDWWTVNITTEDIYAFYRDLGKGGVSGASLEIYQDEDGYMYAKHTVGARSSIWKFHFIQDIEQVIEQVVKFGGHHSYDDFRDTLEYALQDANYLAYNQEISCMMVEEGLEAKVFLSLPYMQEVLIHGTLLYDNMEMQWVIDEETLDYAEAFDTYVEECLF